MAQADALADGPLPDRVSDPGKALASGGSTGRPRIIVSPGPWERVPVDELEGLNPPAASVDEAGERLACQRRMLRDLLDAIAFDREPVSSGRDGLIALELVMAVWQSHRERRPVALPMAQREHPLSRWLADETETQERLVGARR